MQTRLESLKEVLSNLWMGMLGSFVITYAVTVLAQKLKLEPLVTSVVIVTLRTLWSLVRGFAVRRYFNRKTIRHNHWDGKERRGVEVRKN